MSKIFDSKRYTVTLQDHGAGAVLYRKSDGASHFFQPGDDVGTFLEGWEAATEPAEAYSDYEPVTDSYLSQYDDVMTTEEPK